jgi:deazaflavin-dependent oxidoreductase (nitroreductase family)
MNGNDFVKVVLRSPLHALMGNTMLLTVTGCRTGRKYVLPVSYYREGDVLWIVSSRDRTWWRNVRPAAEVKIHLDGKDLEGEAQVIEDQQQVGAGLCEYVRHLPITARALGITLKNGVADLDDARRAATSRLLVKVRLCAAAELSSKRRLQRQ